ENAIADVEDAGITESEGGQLFHSLEVCERVLKGWKTWNTAIVKLSQVFGYLERNYLRSRKSSIVEYGKSKFTKTYFTDLLPPGTEKNTSYGDSLLKSYASITFVFYEAKYWKTFPEELVNRVRQAFKGLTTLISYFWPTGKLWFERFPHAVLGSVAYPLKHEHHGWFCNYKFQNAFEIRRRFMIIDEECAFYSSCGVDTTVIDELVNELTFNLIFRDDFNEIVLEGLDKLLESPQEMRFLKKLCFDLKKNKAIDGELKLKFVLKEYCEKKFQEAIEKYQSNQIDSQLYPNAILYLSAVLENIRSKMDLHFTDKFDTRGLYFPSLQKVVNTPVNNTFVIQQLCKLCDLYFKSKLNSMVDSFPTFCQRIESIYEALSNKVDFLTAYKKDVSRRLLLGKTSSLDEEHALVMIFLSGARNAGDSVNMESMFEDLKASIEVYSRLIDVPEFEFKPLVLEKSMWPDIPSQDLSTVQLPTECTNVLDKFCKEFCKADERNGKKNLDWSNYKLHHLTIAGHFAGGEKSITANMLQAMVILLFNDSDEYTFDQLLDKTKMDSTLLQAVLHTMVTGKCKILKQQGDVIKFNHGFKDKSKTIRLPIVKETATATASSRGSSIDKEVVVDVIEKNRNEEFKSVVVRIMKQAKTLSMTKLLSQSIEILEKRRPVAVIDLKSAIERLITDEFLKRKSRDAIEYIA
ncbi:hypothetical protein CANMA_003041, partial [Candida margitis]|uniref:uncharacterized protein n=1 Tax=Candida margitis TaxID=1775924 RepID=UPI002226DE58